MEKLLKMQSVKMSHVAICKWIKKDNWLLNKARSLVSDIGVIVRVLLEDTLSLIRVFLETTV
jgi:hypothetical protein